VHEFDVRQDFKTKPISWDGSVAAPADADFTCASLCIIVHAFGFNGGQRRGGMDRRSGRIRLSSAYVTAGLF